MRHRYFILVLATAALIVLPAAMARACGASISSLATIAAIQFFVLLPFFITAPVSLVLSVRAALKKEKKSAWVFAISAVIPFGAWCAAAAVNDPGWQAVMGI